MSTRDSRRAYRVVDDFEAELCDFTGAPYAVTVDSCTNALYASLMCWRSVPQMHIPFVTLPRRTYVGVLQAVLNAGFEVFWHDDPWTNAYVLRPTRIVDSARSLWRGMYGRGDTTCLSFHAAKQLPLGRGGAILTDDHYAVEWLQRFRADGRAPGDTGTYATTPAAHIYMPPDTAARGLWILSRWNDSGYEPAPLVPEVYPDLSAITYSARSNPAGAIPERMTVKP